MDNLTRICTLAAKRENSRLNPRPKKNEMFDLIVKLIREEITDQSSLDIAHADLYRFFLPGKSKPKNNFEYVAQAVAKNSESRESMKYVYYKDSKFYASDGRILLIANADSKSTQSLSTDENESFYDKAGNKVSLDIEPVPFENILSGWDDNADKIPLLEMQHIELNYSDYQVYPMSEEIGLQYHYVKMATLDDPNPMFLSKRKEGGIFKYISPLKDRVAIIMGIRLK